MLTEMSPFIVQLCLLYQGLRSNARELNCQPFFKAAISCSGEFVAVGWTTPNGPAASHPVQPLCMRGPGGWAAIVSASIRSISRHRDST